MGEDHLNIKSYTYMTQPRQRFYYKYKDDFTAYGPTYKQELILRLSVLISFDIHDLGIDHLK